MRTRNTPMFLVLGLIALVGAMPALAGPVPSKMAADQTVADRDADLATVHGAFEVEGVAAALEAQGFTRDEAQARIEQLSDEDLRALAGNVEQIQAAGITQEQWHWIGIGALAILLLLVLLD